MRRPVVVAAAILAFAITFGALVPAATAQLGDQALYRVRVAGPGEKIVIRQSLGSAVLEFTVSVECRGAQDYGPCEGQVGQTNIGIEIDEINRANYPSGWTVSLADSSRSFTMKAEEQRRVPVTVKLDTDSPELDSFQVRLRATATPQTVGSPLPLPSDVDQSQRSQHEANGRVEKVLTLAENVESFVRDYQVPLIGGAAVLLLGAVVLSRKTKRKGGRLEVQSDAPSQMVVPGRGASFPVRIRNESHDDDRVRLSPSSLPAGWTAIVPLDEVDLGAEESTQLWVTLRAPSRAIPGQSLSFDLKAASTRFADRGARVSLHVTVGSAYAPAVEPEAPAEPPPELEMEEASPPAPEPETRQRRAPRRRPRQSG